MLRFARYAALFAIALAVVSDHSADAQKKRKKRKPRNEKQVFLDAKSAGPDFQVQGEYVGTIGKGTKTGAQVVALGNGKFDAVLYAKGLPGAGWDGKTKVRLKGMTKDGKTTFTGKNFRGTIEKGEFTGTADEGVKFQLKKTLRKSPTLGAKPPAGAIVLFDGTNVDQWEGMKIEEGKLLGVGGRTKKKFRDFTLHLEFRLPFMPFARGQGRGNSGMYLTDQYECQILDSFGLNGEDNECGGIYHVLKPAVNMCLPPLSWQTYDVEFTAAKFNDKGKKTADAVVTIKHNGVVIHKKAKLKLTPGGHQFDEKPGRLFLQNHGNPVRFRNIWVVDK
jgi:3-keto-disaccharide hydrolase